jgi:hypothetical protein
MILNRRAGDPPRFDFGDLAIAVGAGLALFPLRNNDLWWHLATGRWIVERATVPREDPFSFTGFLGAWIDGQWLSQLALYATWFTGGNAALVLSRAALVVCLLLAVRALLRSRGRQWLFAPTAVASVALSQSWWAVRPSALALLGTLAVLLLIERLRHGSRAWPALPLLLLLMANLHPGFLFALFIFVGMTVAVICEPLLSAWPRWSRDGRARGRLAAAALLSIPATLVNPYGWRVYEQQLAIASDVSYRGLLDEWAPTPARLIVFAVCIAAGFVALGWRRIEPAAMVPPLAAVLLAVSGVRFVEYLALIALPSMTVVLSRPRSRDLGVIAAVLGVSLLLGASPPTDAVLNEGSGLAPDPVTAGEYVLELRALLTSALLAALTAAGIWGIYRRGLIRGVRAWRARSAWTSAPASLLAAAALIAGAAAARVGPPGFVEPLRYPGEDCVAAVSTDEAPRTFNRLSWGGWLIWTEGLPTFVDGRAWNQREFFDYAVAGGPRWREVFERYGISHALVGRTDPLVPQIASAPDWESVCEDGVSIAFRRADRGEVDWAGLDSDPSAGSNPVSPPP